MSMLTLKRRSQGLGLSPRRRGAKGAALPSIVQNGLIAEWRFDDGQGQIITDYSGNGFHAQLGPTNVPESGEPTWSSTGVDCILHAANNFITTGSTIGISGGVARSVIVVALVDAVFDASNFGYGFFKWTGSATSGSAWKLRLDGAAPALRFETNNGIGDSTNLILSDETWHFVAATQSSSDVTSIKLYLDGASENYGSFSVMLNTSGNAFMAPNGDANSGLFKRGKHAYCLVYNRALSDEEIAQNRQALTSILAGRGITLP
jgi:Concanavalin A-like lectin/glucanases superfamily